MTLGSFFTECSIPFGLATSLFQLSCINPRQTSLVPMNSSPNSNSWLWPSSEFSSNLWLYRRLSWLRLTSLFVFLRLGQLFERHWDLYFQAVETCNFEIQNIPAICSELIIHWQTVLDYLTRIAPSNNRQGLEGTVSISIFVLSARQR